MRKADQVTPGTNVHQVYQYIVRYKLENDGNAPTLREICRHLGNKSTSLSSYYLDRLEKAGYIKRVGPRRVIALVGGAYIYPPGG